MAEYYVEYRPREALREARQDSLSRQARARWLWSPTWQRCLWVEETPASADAVDDPDPEGHKDPCLAPTVATRPTHITRGVATVGTIPFLVSFGIPIDEPIVGLVGGLHFWDADERALQPEINYLKARNVQLMALSPHDSFERALRAVRQSFPGAYREVSVGEEIHLETAR